MLPELSSKFPELRKRIIAPFVININPNIISVVALLVAFAAGYFLWQNLLLPAAVFVLLNGFLDMLDGEIAKTYKRETKLGDFLDHSFDRLADVAIVIGLALNPFVPDYLGYLAAIAMLLVSYLGTEAQAITGKRLYAAWLGRGDRLVLIAVGALAQVWFEQALYITAIILLTLSVISFAQRFFAIIKTLAKERV